MAYALQVDIDARPIAYAHPAARWVRRRDAAAGAGSLGEFVLDWTDVCQNADHHQAALAFAFALHHGCTVCGWDPTLLASAQGTPPPTR
jgi:hypothetical protein